MISALRYTWLRVGTNALRVLLKSLRRTNNPEENKMDKMKPGFIKEDIFIFFESIMR